MKRRKLWLVGLLVFILVLIAYFQIRGKEISGKVEFKPRISDGLYREKSVYHLYNINLYPVYEYTDIMNNLEPVKVGVIDTGIVPEHKYLEYEKGSYYKLRCENEYDRAGHGTSVAGIIAARFNPKNHVQGVAPNAKLYIYKMSNNSLNTRDGLSSGLNYLREQAVKVINMSITCEHAYYVHAEIENAFKQEITLVAGAGNSGQEDLTEPIDANYPAYYKETIAVGATNGRYEKISYSSYGEQLDLVAPGYLINSTSIRNYSINSGTSFSTPIVTGLAALLKGQDPSLTNKEIRDLLTSYTQKIGDELKVGAGIPDAYRLLTRTKLDDAVVFLGEEEGDTIHRISDTYRVKKGKFSFKENISKEAQLFIWIDVDESGGINPGDYFYSAEPDKKIQAELDLIDSEYNLE